MIVANLATYPARKNHLRQVVAAISPQVDRLNIVLNEYDAIPQYLSRYTNVHGIIPDHDTKDAGKFYPDTTGATYVVLIDDDIGYPSNFVSTLVESVQATGLARIFAGYHTSIYHRPPISGTVYALKRLVRFYLSPNHIARFRTIHHFGKTLDQNIYVDQIGTGAAIITGADMPSYRHMRSSQKFVDVRIAKWCFERAIPRVSLNRISDWLTYYDVDESIFTTFTQQHPKHVATEIWSYAFKDERVGHPLKR